MCERILAQNCQKFDNFNFEFSMSHHNAHYQSYKNAPYNELHSQERYERYCVNKPKSECVVKVVIYFLFKFFLGSMACTYKEQLSCSTHCLSATTYLMAGKLKMLARFIAPFFRYFFLKTSSVLLLLFPNI